MQLWNHPPAFIKMHRFWSHKHPLSIFSTTITSHVPQPNNTDKSSAWNAYSKASSKLLEPWDTIRMNHNKGVFLSQLEARYQLCFHLRGHERVNFYFGDGTILQWFLLSVYSQDMNLQLCGWKPKTIITSSGNNGALGKLEYKSTICSNNEKAPCFRCWGSWNWLNSRSFKYLVLCHPSKAYITQIVLFCAFSDASYFIAVINYWLPAQKNLNLFSITKAFQIYCQHSMHIKIPWFHKQMHKKCKSETKTQQNNSVTVRLAGGEILHPVQVGFYKDKDCCF